VVAKNSRYYLNPKEKVMRVQNRARVRGDGQMILVFKQSFDWGGGVERRREIVSGIQHEADECGGHHAGS